LKDTHRIVGIRLLEFPSLFSNLKSKNFCLQLTSTNFLYQMVRRLTTELIQVAQGQLTLEEFQQKLYSSNEKQFINNDNNKLLDINGLYLQNVMYDEQDFQRYVTYTTLKTMKNKLYPLVPVLTGEE
jgi:tRNA U38,U39,U40 pseudouridine synthase TruA